MKFKHKYELTKHEFGQAFHYAMQYEGWKKEYRSLQNTTKAITYDEIKENTNSINDPTMKIVARRLYLESKMKIVEETSRESDKFIWQFILRGVTEEGCTYEKLRAAGMPCGRNYYYDRRRRFYWILSRKI